MAYTYDFVSWTIKDGNSFAVADQTAEPAAITLGDKKILVLNYQYAEQGLAPTFVVSETIYFNPALAGTPAISTTTPPSSGFLFAAPANADGTPSDIVLGVMDFFGAPQNRRVGALNPTITRTAGALSISLVFDCLSDLNGYISPTPADNAARLTTHSGIYAVPGRASFLTGADYTSNTGGLFADPAGNRFVIGDGTMWDMGASVGDVTITGAPAINGTYTITSVTPTELITDPAPPVRGLFSCIATLDGLNPYARAFSVNGQSTGTAFNGGIKTVLMNGSKPDRAGSGYLNPALTIVRNGMPQTALSTVEPSTVTISIQSAGLLTPAKMRLWVQNKTAVSNTRPAASDEALQADLSAGITSPSPNVYETVYVSPATAAREYLFLAVWYDEAADKVESFLFETPAATGEQAETAYPDIQSRIEDYLNEFGDYVKAPVFGRLRLSVFLDKSSYNARTVVGSFAANFKRWEMRVFQDGTQVRLLSSEAEPPEIAVNDTLTNFELALSLRVEKAWAGSQVKCQWYFYFNNGLQSDRIGFHQLIDAHDEQRNIINSIVYDNEGIFNPAHVLTSFCGDLAQVATVRTESSAGAFMQMAVLVLPQIQEEETYTVGALLPQSEGANLLEVDQVWAGGFARAKIDIEGIKPDAVAILAKQITEEISVGVEFEYQLIDQA